MWSLPSLRLRGKKVDELSTDFTGGARGFLDEESTLLRTLGWLTAALGAVAVGLFVGAELRQRYKFNRRTPYDFYAHAGDEQEREYSLGT